MEPNKGQTLTVTRWIFQCVIATFCLSISFAETGFADVCDVAISTTNNQCAISSAGQAHKYHPTDLNPITESCFRNAKKCLEDCEYKGGPNGQYINMRANELIDFIRSLEYINLASLTQKQKNCLKDPKKLANYLTGKARKKNTAHNICNDQRINKSNLDSEETTFNNRCDVMAKIPGNGQFNDKTFNGQNLKKAEATGGSCEPNGQGQIINGQCQVFSCKNNYRLENGKCVQKFKNPSFTQDDCDPGKTRDPRTGKCTDPSPIVDMCKTGKHGFQWLGGNSSSGRCLDCRPIVGADIRSGHCSGNPVTGKKDKCENGGTWNGSKNGCDCPAPWEGPRCERKKACDEYPTPTGELIVICDSVKKSEYKKCIKDPKTEWVNDQCKPKKEDPNPTDPEKKACENAIAAGQKKMWNDAMGTCEDIEGPEKPEKPEDPQKITKDDVDKLKKAMDEAAANLGGGGGNGFGGGNNGIPNAGKINVGDNNGGGFDSSGFDSSDDSGRSSDFGGVAADATPRSPVPLFRGKTPIVGVKRDNQQNAGNGQPGNNGGGGGLGGNPGGFGGGNNAKAAKLKKGGRRGRSRLWEAAKQLVSGSYFGGGGGGAPSGGPRNHQQAQRNSRRFVPDGRGGYVDTKGMTTAELQSLNESFRANIPGYQQKYAPASHGLLGDEYNQQVTTILKKEVMLNRYGCEPPLTSCDAVKRLTASAKRKRRPSSVKSKKKQSRKKYRKKRRIKRRRKKRK